MSRGRNENNAPATLATLAAAAVAAVAVVRNTPAAGAGSGSAGSGSAGAGSAGSASRAGAGTTAVSGAFLHAGARNPMVSELLSNPSNSLVFLWFTSLFI